MKARKRRRGEETERQSDREKERGGGQERKTDRRKEGGLDVKREIIYHFEAYLLLVLRTCMSFSFLVDFWDTAGQERFNSMHSSYYHQAHACILVSVLRSIQYILFFNLHSDVTNNTMQKTPAVKKTNLSTMAF